MESLRTCGRSAILLLGLLFVVAGLLFGTGASQAAIGEDPIEPSEGALVSDIVEAKKIRAQWQQDFQRLGIQGSLSNCRLMLNPAYKDQRDATYGAVCSYNNGKKPRDIMLCDDTMIGNLTIKAYGFAETERQVFEFTKTNCPPGG